MVLCATALHVHEPLFFSVIIEACTLDGEEEDEVKGHLMCMMSLGLKEIKMMYKTP